MKRNWLITRLAWIGIVILVVVLGMLQHRWMGEVVRSERQRLTIVVHASSRHAAYDFDRELSRVFLHFQPPAMTEIGDSPGGFYSDLWDSWIDVAEDPQLVHALFWIQRRDDGGHQLRQFDAEAGDFLSVEWPNRLLGVRDQLAHPVPEHEPDQDVDIPFPLLPDLPGLVIPLAQVRPATGTEPHAADNDLEAHINAFLATIIVVELDLDHIITQLLPELLDKYQLGADSDYEVALRIKDSDTTLFSSTTASVDEIEPAAKMPLFALRPLAELRSMWVDMRARGLSRRESAGLNLAAIIVALGGDQSGWELVVAHSDGSLEAVVARNQRRHLWITGGLMAILGLAMATILLSNRRAQALAQQQVEFVAGVSHELRTPLASIKSLSQNLSQGRVTEADQIERYGTMIEREEKRLTRMVEQVLDFSGALAGHGVVTLTDADLASIVQTTVVSIRPIVEEAGKEIDVELIAPSLPVQADPEALGRALQNLISNAIKYGGDGRRIRVEVGSDDESSTAYIQVRDTGPGIEKEDLGHVFEPFYRSDQAKSSQIPGSGLGLSFVQQVAEAHGGHAEVETRKGEGAAFRIILPLHQGIST